MVHFLVTILLPDGRQVGTAIYYLLLTCVTILKYIRAEDNRRFNTIYVLEHHTNPKHNHITDQYRLFIYRPVRQHLPY